MFKKRTIFSKIWQYIDDHRIILLNGARQTGKTTLMKMIKEKLIAEKKILPDNILWFDLEKTNDLEIWSSQTKAINSLPKDNAKLYYLFIDEFQQAAKIGSTLKVIHDHYPYIKIIITGSASWYLNIDESMAGRKIVIPIFPLNFTEFLQWNSNEQNNKLTFFKTFAKDILNSSPKAISIINEQFYEFTNWGGYPQTILSDNNEQKISILDELINSYLTRDIKIWNFRATTLEVKKLLTLLAGTVGSTLSVDRLCKDSELGRELLNNRLDLLQNTFILQLIPPYFTNKRKEITKSPKIYLIDTGLRNSLTKTFLVQEQTPEFGRLVENTAVIELMKNALIMDQIFFWRTIKQNEVDIILKRENKLIPIEVKAGNQTTIPTGLKAFIRQYKPEKAFVLNWSIVKDDKYQGCDVCFRPLWFACKI